MKFRCFGRLIKKEILTVSIIILSIIVIIILELTDCRPFGFATRASSINRILVTTSYSVIAAYVFYVINKFIPSLSKNNVSYRHIDRQLRCIRECLRLTKTSILLFSLEQENYSKEDYAKLFESTNLYDKYSLTNRPLIDYINERKKEIIEISENLLSSYSTIMSKEELYFLNSLLDSEFILNTIIPQIFPLESNEGIYYHNNQYSVGVCIYELYEKAKKLK